ncbi:MAG: BlaI/MecI/CopY family transcriptional regulator [Gemmataceae bacterium]
MRKVPDVSDAELAVLHALWERGDATIRQLTDRLYPGGGPALYATVQKLLERLEDKDCVRRDRSAMAHTFRAAISRDALIGRQLREVAAKLCGGSMAPLLTHLLQAESLSTRERRELRRLLNESAI